MIALKKTDRRIKNPSGAHHGNTLADRQVFVSRGEHAPPSV